MTVREVYNTFVDPRSVQMLIGCNLYELISQDDSQRVNDIFLDAVADYEVEEIQSCGFSNFCIVVKVSPVKAGDRA